MSLSVHPSTGGAADTGGVFELTTQNSSTELIPSGGEEQEEQEVQGEQEEQGVQERNGMSLTSSVSSSDPFIN